MSNSNIKRGYSFFAGDMAKKGYIGITDQAVVSGGNFLTGVLLGRFVAPEEFGMFVVIWTTLMIVMSFQNALVCTPMSVIGAQKPEPEGSVYRGSMLIVQAVIGGGASLLIVFTGLILHGFSLVPATQGPLFPLMAATSFCCFFLLGQEFFRRLLIIKLSLGETLLNDLITNTVRIGGLLYFYYMGTLDTVLCMVVIAVSSSIGSLLGYLRSYRSITIFTPAIRRNFLESFSFGKWVMAEMLPYMLSVQGYIYLTALIIGSRQTAALGASQNILNAANILILSFSNILTPVASMRYAEGGGNALFKLMVKAGILSAVPILGFYLFAMLFAQKILVLVYKQNYAGFGALLVICSLYYVFSYFNRFLQIMLYAMRKPDIGFYAKTVSLIVMVVCAYPLIRYYGVYGAAVGTVISQVVILGGFLFYLTGGKGIAENYKI
jgi:O-antigen/teichoic acid export membrane protein